jgi:RNA polymerase sigma factor (TIGR02999 family)
MQQSVLDAAAYSVVGGVRQALRGILRGLVKIASRGYGWVRNTMNEPADRRVTELLVDWSSGDQRALGELLPLVYGELRRLADRQLRAERPSHTLQRTALVHEAYLRLINQKNVNWQGRAQFIGLAAQLMRRILIDHARSRGRAKRGGGMTPVRLEQTGVVLGSFGEESVRVEALEFAQDPSVDLSAIDSALCRLEALDPKQGRIVELRFFGGLTIEETAEIVDLSPATVKREWALARAWLRRELMSETSP